MSKKIKTTVRFPQELKKLMLQAVINDGYGLRGKSQWVNEAIEEFLQIKTFVDLVDIGSEVGNGELIETESFYLSTSVVDKLEDATVEVRKYYPKIEGIRSIIIRSSILQRLFRSKK